MYQYSYKSIQLSFSHLIAGTFVLNGEQAAGGITITPLIDHTAQEVTPDGATINNFIPGNNATLTVQVQQVSEWNDFLVGWHNDCVMAAEAGDMSNYATASALVIDTNSGRTHTMQGIAPSKIPDTPYGAQSQMVSWVLKVSTLVTE
jgi:hypothetical protein